MSTTKYYDFTGTAKWCKHRKPDDKYNNYSIDLYMDDKSWEIFKNSGLQLRPKEDADGKFVKFRRPVSKLIKNAIANFQPPKAQGPGGEDFSTTIIGNGSSVIVNVSVYDSMKGKGHRWEEVQVTNLIPYEPDGPQANVDQAAPPQTAMPF